MNNAIVAALPAARRVDSPAPEGTELSPRFDC